MCARSRRAAASCATHVECAFLQQPKWAEPHRPAARQHLATAPALIDVRTPRLVVGAARCVQAAPPPPWSESLLPYVARGQLGYHNGFLLPRLPSGRSPSAPQCASRCVAARRSQRVVPQEHRTECADGPVPRLRFVDAIHRQSVRCPCSGCLFLAPPLGPDGCPVGCLARTASPGCFPPTSRRCRHCGSCTPLPVVPRLRPASYRFSRACSQERHFQLARR